MRFGVWCNGCTLSNKTEELVRYQPPPPYLHKSGGEMIYIIKVPTTRKNIRFTRGVSPVYIVRHESLESLTQLRGESLSTSEGFLPRLQSCLVNLNKRKVYMEKEIKDGQVVSEISGYYQVVTKDNEGEAHIHTLEKHSTKVRPTPEEIGHLLVREALPTKITPTRRVKPKRPDSLTLSIPDAQIPFHDERALKLAHVAIRETYPDNIVNMGDMIDFPSLSRFEQRPEWTNQVQDSLDRTHQMLAQQRADAPDSRIYYLFGNHEQRLQKHMVHNNAELLGIKRANAEKELGVMTLEFLLRAKELEVEMIQGYPNGELWLEDDLVFKHGTIAKANQSTSLEYLKQNPYVNTVHGHSHRAEIQYRTTPTRDGYKQRWAMSAGTVAKINGEVPSYHSTIDEHGEVVERAENWQQGVGIIEHNERLSNPSLAMIHDETIMIQGKMYEIS